MAATLSALMALLRKQQLLFLLLGAILMSSMVYCSDFTDVSEEELLELKDYLGDFEALTDEGKGHTPPNLTHVMDHVHCKEVPELPPFGDPVYLNHTFKDWNSERLHKDSDFLSVGEHVTGGSPEDPKWPETRFYDLPKGTYHVHAWVRISGVGDAFHYVHFGKRLHGEHINNSRIAASGIARGACWSKLEGGFNVKNALENITLHLGGVPGHHRILVSSFSLSQINSPAWTARQNVMINKLRKAAITIKVRYRSKPANKAVVKITQIAQGFPFGGAVTSAIKKSKTYRNWFVKRFNIATFQNELKWYVNEPKRGHLNFSDADAITSTLKKLKIPIRGHCVFWNPVSNIQKWVQKLSRPALKRAVSRRVRDVVGRYKGRFIHWDVVNEALHGAYLDEKLKDRNFVASMFRLVDQVDPIVQKFLNDYNIIEYYNDPDSSASKVIEQVKNINAAGARVDRLGVQGHFYDAVPAKIKGELDILGRAGVPVWMTEFDMTIDNINDRADAYEAVLRETFSHPDVGGIVQWEVARVPCSLLRLPTCSKKCTNCLTSPTFKDNLVGKRYLKLLNEWKTNVNRVVGTSGNFKFRGFHGKYKAVITYKGKNYVRYFSVQKGTTSATRYLRM